MRRAFQRCSASLPRALSTIPSSRHAASQCLRRDVASQNVLRSSLASFRSLHQSSQLRQQEASQSEPNESSQKLITKFVDLEKRKLVHRNVIEAITQQMGLETMTDVQSKTISAALGGQDMIAQAKTGTGKTLAFLLPVLQNIIAVDAKLAHFNGRSKTKRATADDIRALIVSPTRELAEQIAAEAKKVVSGTGMLVQTAVGGTRKTQGLRDIQKQGCHILVGTPGRLKDILSDPYSRVEAPDLSALVFDEADRLLDQGFWPEIQEIMRLLPTPEEKDRQTLMFSATVPKDVVSLVRQTLKPGFQFVKTVDDNEEPTHTRVPQNLVVTNGFENNFPALVELCTTAIEASQAEGARPFKAIVYFNSSAEVTLANAVFRALSDPSVTSDGRRARHPLAPAKINMIHARLTQAARTTAADNFKRAESGILLSTDVTARGMDFPNVTHVIQLGVPSSRDQYVHRIGRTARAGKEGEGWLIVSEMEVKESRSRLHDLPLKPTDQLQSARADLSQPDARPESEAASKALATYDNTIHKVDQDLKNLAYQSMIGVFGWFSRKRDLFQAMNKLATIGWKMEEPPTVGARLAQKLGLTKVEGVRVGKARPMGDSPGGFGGSRERSGGYGGRERSGGFGGPPRERSGGYGGRERSRYGSDGRSGGYGGGRRDEGRGYGGDRGGSSYGQRRQPRGEPFA